MSTSFYPPYLLARLSSTVDSIAHGRFGWNIVSSAEDRAAQNFWLDGLPEHDERYNVAEEYFDAGKVLGAGLAFAALGLLGPAAFGGRIGQSYDVSFHLGLLGSPHLVTSVFFDVGVYLVVVGVMLDLARSLGAGIDTHEAEDRAPSPGRVVVP